MDAATLKAIADAGGWVFAAAAIAGAAWWYLRQIATGALVPGILLTQSMQQNDRLVEAMGRVTGSVETMTTQTTAAIRELRDDIRDLRSRIPRRD